jgi:MGT family glycosyltransferase
MNEPKRFLFVMWDGGGNVPPVLGLAKRLIAKGHIVRLLADPTLADEARAIGAEHTSWVTAPHRKSRRPEDDVVKDYESASPFAMIRNYIESFVGVPAPQWAAETRAALESSRADVLFADVSIPAALIVGEKLGVPTAAFMPNIWLLPTPGIPPIGPGFAPARGPFGRARDWLLRTVSHRAFAPAIPYLNAVRTSYGLPPVATVYEQMVRADEVYVLTSPRFDFTSPSMPPNVRYGGPILDDPAWCASWDSPWKPDDARPLVLVGLSSTYQKQAPVLRRIVEALSSLPVRALVTLGLTVSPDEVSGCSNVVVVGTAPHTQILREASLLITHCGHGTTMRGLAARVPLVCIPMGRDQNDTAARVVHHGAGLRLSPKASASKIRTAVERVLADPKYRQNAQKLGAAITSRDGCVDVVESLERLANSPRIRDAERRTEPAAVGSDQDGSVIDVASHRQRDLAGFG